MTISKIVSGGQTGVDQGALQACQWIDFPYGGWVPKGRLTEVGPLPETFKGMQEHGSADYLKRTEANVVDSDATLVMTRGKPTGGSRRTSSSPRSMVGSGTTWTWTGRWPKPWPRSWPG